MNEKEFLLKKKGNRPNRAFICNENYDQGTYVLWPVTTQQLLDEYTHINPKHGIPHHAFEMGGGKYLVADGWHCIAFCHNKPPIDTLAHEAFHYTHRLLGDLGMKHTQSSDEAYAYFLGWATERLYNITHKHK